MRQMVLCPALCTTMERNDDNVALLLQIVDNPFDGSQILMAQGIGVMTESTEAVTHPIALHHRRFHPALDARKLDTLFRQHPFRTLYALLAEVVGMVVGHAQVVVTGIGEQRSKTGGHTEGITVRTISLGRSATIADSTLQIAYRQVGSQGIFLRILEQVAPVVGGQLLTGKSGAHHDIATHGDGHGVGQLAFKRRYAVSRLRFHLLRGLSHL